MGNPRQWDLGGMDLVVNSVITGANGPGRATPLLSTGSINIQHKTITIAGAAPTAAELTTGFGAPASLGNGFIAIAQRNGTPAQIHLVFVANSLWHVVTHTPAA